ncbi:imidazole glycerol phosphate synthase subunit HisH [Pilimelia columellifera subsp. columellifera]|uniref:Imidazole glycerol phosphate synthase subunit HisH n=2 Tax=Pilimelia TaxID=53370 RepID=A0ABN3N9C8_9ACTN
MRVVVLDYGSGNLRSAQRALERAGADTVVTANLDAAAQADGLVVPGVGAYAACMAGLTELGGGPVIANRVAEARPVLGICVGMQIMFERGDEHGVRTDGLGLLPGAVTQLPTRRLPHMGWNTVTAPVGAGIGEGERCYFVHSYAASDVAALTAAGAQVATARHEDAVFVAAARLGALTVTQFHPEKSADAGAALLRAWVGGLGR